MSAVADRERVRAQFGPYADIYRRLSRWSSLRDRLLIDYEALHQAGWLPPVVPIALPTGDVAIFIADPSFRLGSRTIAVAPYPARITGDSVFEVAGAPQLAAIADESVVASIDRRAMHDPVMTAKLMKVERRVVACDLSELVEKLGVEDGVVTWQGAREGEYTDVAVWAGIVRPIEAVAYTEVLDDAPMGPHEVSVYGVRGVFLAGIVDDLKRFFGYRGFAPETRALSVGDTIIEARGAVPVGVAKSSRADVAVFDVSRTDEVELRAVLDEAVYRSTLLVPEYNEIIVVASYF